MLNTIFVMIFNNLWEEVPVRSSKAQGMEFRIWIRRKNPC